AEFHAKLPSMITYLEIIAALHQEYSGFTPEKLKAVPRQPDDHITSWALSYLATTQERSLKAMLEAALQRKYSGNPGETFFTAGGVHHFENFEKSENGQVFPVPRAFAQP